MENKASGIGLPGAIIIAGAMIAVSIIWIKSPSKTPAVQNTNAQAETINLQPITAADHIFGNPNAPIRIVEYSDTSCPYCKDFHKTMVELLNQNGSSGKVAWIYRHYPLDAADADGNILHPNANLEAQATECATELGGNKAFWEYTNKLYEITPSVTSKNPKGLDPKMLPQIAKDLKLDETAFNSCLSSGKYKETVAKQRLEGTNSGVVGTPTSFIVLGDSINKNVPQLISDLLIQYRVPQDLIKTDGKIILMRGALPTQIVNGLIQTILAN